MRIFIPVLVPVVILAGAAGVAGAASQGFTIFNAIDQAAGNQAITTIEQAAATTSSASTDHKSWIQRMLDGINVVFAAATAAAKYLFA